MLRILRWLVLILTPAIFWCAWYIVPGILGSGGLRYLSGIVTILWGLEFWFFQKISNLPYDGLSSRESERLELRLEEIRRRVWWIGGIGLVSSVSVWLLVELQLPGSSPLYAAMVGILFGISLSYLILIPGWVNETQRFVDKAKRIEKITKQQSEAAKALSDAEK